MTGVWCNKTSCRRLQIIISQIRWRGSTMLTTFSAHMMPVVLFDRIFAVETFLLRHLTPGPRLEAFSPLWSNINATCIDLFFVNLKKKKKKKQHNCVPSRKNWISWLENRSDQTFGTCVSFCRSLRGSSTACPWVSEGSEAVPAQTWPSRWLTVYSFHGPGRERFQNRGRWE